MQPSNNESGSHLKRILFSKDEVYFQAVELFETDDGLKVMGLVHENEVVFFFSYSSVHENSKDRLEKNSVFQIENKPRPEYKDILLACSFGVVSTESGNQLVFACGGEIGHIYLLYLENPVVNRLSTLQGHFNSVMGIRFLKNHRNRLLSCSQDHSIICWDPHTSEVIHRIIDIDNEMSCVNCLVT